jgi:hypothetical protein
MQSTITIPKHWDYPRFALDQRTKDGIILGFYYREGEKGKGKGGKGRNKELFPTRYKAPVFKYGEQKKKIFETR